MSRLLLILAALSITSVADARRLKTYYGEGHTWQLNYTVWRNDNLQSQDVSINAVNNGVDHQLQTIHTDSHFHVRDVFDVPLTVETFGSDHTIYIDYGNRSVTIDDDTFSVAFADGPSHFDANWDHTLNFGDLSPMAAAISDTVAFFNHPDRVEWDPYSLCSASYCDFTTLSRVADELTKINYFGAGSAESSGVPEPGATILVMVALLLQPSRCLRRRR